MRAVTQQVMGFEEFSQNEELDSGDDNTSYSLNLWIRLK